jgi:hypothetical protein
MKNISTELIRIRCAGNPPACARHFSADLTVRLKRQWHIYLRFIADASSAYTRKQPIFHLEKWKLKQKVFFLKTLNQTSRRL